MKKISKTKIFSVVILLFITHVIRAQNDPTLLYYLPFDGNTADRSSNGRANTQLNVTYVNDHENRAGMAGSFVSAGNRVEATYTHPSTQGLTFGFWFKPNVNLTGASARTIFAEHLGFYLLDYQAGKLRFFVRNQVPVDIEYSMTTNFTANTWYHVVFTINSLTEQAFLYIDNVKNTIQTASTILGTNNTKLTIGSANGGSFEIAATLDELRIYSKALTDTEVASLYIDKATVNLNLSNNSVNEGSYNKQLIGTLSSSDADVSDIISYALVTASNIFTLSNDSLFITANLDFETINSYAIRVRASNQLKEGIESDFTISVNNVDEKPYYKGKFTEYSSIINRTFQFKLTTTDFTDPEGTAIGNYEAKLSNGDPLPLFINFSTAGLIFNLTPQATDTGIYNIKLRFFDNTGKDSVLNLKISVSGQIAIPYNTSLLAYFSFDSTSVESSEKAYIVNPVAPLYNTDRNGKTYRAISYSAVGNRTETTFTHPAGNEFSLSFFVRPDNNLNTASTRTILSEHKNLYLLDYITGNLRLYIRNSANVDILYSLGINLASGNWHHIVFTVNANTGNAYIYINNIMYKVQAASNIKGTPNARLTIGAADGGVAEFAGYIDEWRIYTRELNANEIALLYTNIPPTSISFVGDSINENATIGSYTGKFSASDSNIPDSFKYTLPVIVGTDNSLFSISNDSLLINGSINFESKATLNVKVRLFDGAGEFIEKSIKLFVRNINEAPVYTGQILESKIIEGKSLTIKFDSVNFIDPENKIVDNYTTSMIDNSNLPSWLIFNPNGLSFVANPLKGDTGIYQVRINFEDEDNIKGEHVFNIFVISTLSNYTDSGLVSAYKLNNNFNPVSGNIVGTTNGAVSSNNRFNEINKSFLLNGTTDIINFTNNAAYGFKTKFTLSLWFYQTGAGSALTAPVGSGILIGREGEFLLATDGTGGVFYAINISNPSWKWMDSGLKTSLNTWNHVALTYDAGKIIIYLNGKFTYTYNGTNQAIGDYYPAMNNLLVGGREFFPNQQNFKGKIDDISLFNRALNANEVFGLYNPIFSIKTFKDTVVKTTQLTLALGKVSKTYGTTDEYPLTYSVSSSNNLFNAKIENDSIIIESSTIGQSSVTLTVSNGFNQLAHTFKVTTTIPNEINIVERTEAVIYPTRVTDKLNIEGLKPGSSITFYNVNGAKVFETNISSYYFSLTLSNLPKGIYIVRSNDATLKPSIIVKE